MDLFIVFRPGTEPVIRLAPEKSQHQFDAPKSIPIVIETNEIDGCFTESVEINGHRVWLSVFVGTNFNQENIPECQRKPFGVSVYTTKQPSHIYKKGAFAVNVKDDGGFVTPL